MVWKNSRVLHLGSFPQEEKLQEEQLGHGWLERLEMGRIYAADGGIMFLLIVMG